MMLKHRGNTLAIAILLTVCILAYIARYIWLLSDPAVTFHQPVFVIVELVGYALVALLALLGLPKLATGLTLAQSTFFMCLNFYWALSDGTPLTWPISRLIFVITFILIFVNRKLVLLPLLYLLGEYYVQINGYATYIVNDLMSPYGLDSNFYPMIFLTIVMMVLSFMIPALTILLYDEVKRLEELGDQGIYQDNLVLNVLYSLVSMGLFDVIWAGRLFYSVRDLNQEKKTVTAHVLGAIFLPYFHIYLLYKVNKKLNSYYQARGLGEANSVILTIVLSLLGWRIIPMALMQNKLNTLEDTSQTSRLENVV